MTISPQTLWLGLTVIICIMMAIQAYVMAGYYQSVTEIQLGKKSAHLELSWKLVVGWSLAPGVIGAVACLAQANTYL